MKIIIHLQRESVLPIEKLWNFQTRTYLFPANFSSIFRFQKKTLVCAFNFLKSNLELFILSLKCTKKN